MKQDIFFELSKKLKSQPKLRQKIMIFAVVEIIGLFTMGAFAVWAGISFINYVASSASQAIQSPIAQSQVERAKEELKSLPKLQLVSCWGKAQSLLAVQPWIEQAALVNLTDLKLACFEQKPTACQGVACE
jgi:hypothetical protein